MGEVKSLPEIVERMSHRDFVLSLLYLKPGSPLFKEQEFVYGVKKIAEEYPQLKEKGFFQNHNYNGSYGGKQTGLDDILDGLHFCLVADSPGLQYAQLTALGKAKVEESIPEEYGRKVLEELRPFAQEVWKLAKEYHKPPQLELRA